MSTVYNTIVVTKDDPGWLLGSTLQ